MGKPSLTNLEIGNKLREIAAAYEILGENKFKIIAYNRAADSIEHLTSEVKDLWDDGKLGEIPGAGPMIISHLDEIFRTGKSHHFDQVLSKIPQSVFPLLLVPGIGPKKAFKLVTELNLTKSVNIITDLKKAAKSHLVAPIEGFGERSEQVILDNIAAFEKGRIKENWMNLPEADEIADKILLHLKTCKDVQKVDKLGSLRRQAATIGDIYIAVATLDADKVIKHFLTYPHHKLIEKGPSGASLLLHNGHQVDLRVIEPAGYGSMLQYFTGSKNHNIKLRSLALSRNLSLSEYGIKNIRTKKLTKYHDEVSFYRSVGLPFIEPELREDSGEIEAGVKNQLPKLVNINDIKGDLHLHSSYNLEPSHDLGVNSIEEILNIAEQKGYEYIGLSDHNPSMSNHNAGQIVEIMKRRKDYYEQHYYSWLKKGNKRVKIVIMCEVDILPTGEFALPEEAFAYVDAVIASVHSVFNMEKSQMTYRLIKAVSSNDKVRIIGHPTGRLLGRREGFEMDWEQIFGICEDKDIALEINSFPLRLDLPDSLVRDAVNRHIKLCINTDSHVISQMEFLNYGVSVARRGWATKRDIVNSLTYNEFIKWIKKV